MALLVLYVIQEDVFGLEVSMDAHTMRMLKRFKGAIKDVVYLFDG